MKGGKKHTVHIHTASSVLSFLLYSWLLFLLQRRQHIKEGRRGRKGQEGVRCGTHALLPSNFWVKFHLRLILIVKGFAKLLFATVRQKIKGILQYPIPAHTSLYMYMCGSARVYMCVCVWLLWPECCCVAGVRLVVPPGRHLTMGRKTPTIRVCPRPRLHLPSPYPSGNAFKQQFNSSLPAFCYW